MSSRPDAPRPMRLAAFLRAVAAACLLAILLAATSAAAQQPDALKAPAEWQQTLSEAADLLAKDNASTEEIEAMRGRLRELRSRAVDLETQATAKVAEINGRITGIGPAPAEGATEAPEVAQLRKDLSGQLSDAQAPLVAAQDAQRQADLMIREADKRVRARFTAELRGRGPSPLNPAVWRDGAESIAAAAARFPASVAATFASPEARRALLGRVPFDLFLALAGVWIAFVVRGRLVGWVEDRLPRARGPRAVAALVALRNFSRLIVPAAGAGLIFGALNPARLVDPSAQTSAFLLPAFLAAAIASTWLAASVFAPKLPAYRLAPLSDEMAARGARLTYGLGIVLALYLFARRYLIEWDLNIEALTVLIFPLFPIGALMLWRVAAIIRAIRKGLIAENAAAGPQEQRAGAITLGALEIVRAATLAVAVTAPLLAAGGYLTGASYLMFATMFTLALAGTGVVLFDLLTTLLGGLSGRGGRGEGRAARGLHREGLTPVIVAALLVLAALPALALIWGARTTDLANVVYVLRDGVSYGGMRISFGTISTFALVFGLLYAVTRLMQSVLRNTVLPRTRMDAGGRNALVTGIGYIGFMVATVAAVSSTGIDLSSLAFVAGALSVGIGFGMQNVVSNFVSGIILLVERPIKEGDWIEVGGFSGYVRRISVRSTVVETFDRASVILPNTDLIAGTVLNRTHTGLSGRLQVPVTVAHDADPRAVERILLEIAESYPLVLTDPAPRVLLMETGPDNLLFEIRCWLRDVNFSLSAKSDMNFEILERFAKADIHLRPYLREAWTSGPGAAPALALAAVAQGGEGAGGAG